MNIEGSQTHPSLLIRLRDLEDAAAWERLEARDPALDRVVAIKMLAPAVAGRESYRQRFVREARAAAAVQHDHIVVIHAVGEEVGLPYIVMQRLAGPLRFTIESTGATFESLAACVMAAESGDTIEVSGEEPLEVAPLRVTETGSRSAELSLWDGLLEDGAQPEAIRAGRLVLPPTLELGNAPNVTRIGPGAPYAAWRGSETYQAWERPLADGG